MVLTRIAPNPSSNTNHPKLLYTHRLNLRPSLSRAKISRKRTPMYADADPRSKITVDPNRIFWRGVDVPREKGLVQLDVEEALDEW
jgi:hypothetical protein